MGHLCSKNTAVPVKESDNQSTSSHPEPQPQHHSEQEQEEVSKKEEDQEEDDKPQEEDDEQEQEEDERSNLLKNTEHFEQTEEIKEEMAEQRMIGKWIIGETLGEGGFSKVKLGTHCDTGQRAALKIMQKNRFTMRDSQMKQVTAEIEAMGKIKHPNVINLLDQDFNAKYPKANGSTQDVMLVVLELADGGEFFDFLSHTGCFDETIARSYFHQLIDGLECCHQNHVAHRDIKPENLLLDGKFNLKIADFGFSKVLAGAEDSMSTECGTRGYMAPEILKHNRYSTKADIFSAGVVLFICLAGFPPFQIATRQDWWFHKLLTNRHGLFWEAHTRAAYFSDSAKDLINKVLDPNPETRLSAEQIKEHEWYKGKTVSDEAMFLELERRKRKVDAQRAAEMRRRGAHQQVAAGGHINRAVDAGGPGVAVDAQVGYDDEGVLPSGNPNFAQMFGGKGQTIDGDGGGLVPALSEAPGSPSSSPVPQEYDETSHVTGYTHFYSRSSPSNILDRLYTTLKTLHAQFNVTDSAFHISAKLSAESGVLKFVAQIFTVKDSDGLVIVDFRRRTGDPMQFRKTFNTISEDLGDLVVPDPRAEVLEDEDESKEDVA